MFVPINKRFISWCALKRHNRFTWRYKMVYARVSLVDYANKVLNVIKAKFDLQDKSEAINKFVEMYGDEFVEKEANDQYVKKIIEIGRKHFKNHGYKKMTKGEFNELFGLN